MNALLSGIRKLKKWLTKMTKILIYRERKEVRKLKGKPPELTAWDIIKLLA